MEKPLVFNYQDYVNAAAEIDELKEENERLRKQVANMEIHLRILQTERENENVTGDDQKHDKANPQGSL